MRILVVGATGLVGQGVLRTTLDDERVSRVGVLGRRPCGRRHPRLQEILVADFANLAPFHEQLQGWDACLYCAGALPIGTSEAEYRHVTVELTRNVAATLAELNPGSRFLYISGAHANPHSRIMPLRVKGEAEVALDTLPLRTVMLRPGTIRPALGERSPHRALRLMNAVAGPFMGWGMKLLPSMLTDTAHLSRAMLALAFDADPPAVVENTAINRLGRA